MDCVFYNANNKNSISETKLWKEKHVADDIWLVLMWWVTNIETCATFCDVKPAIIRHWHNDWKDKGQSPQIGLLYEIKREAASYWFDIWNWNWFML